MGLVGKDNTMEKVIVKELSHDAFRPYGEYCDLLNPRNPLYAQGQPQFYSDIQRINTEIAGGLSVSVGLENKRESNMIEFAEFHSHTDEGMLPLDGDVIVYFAPATGKKLPPFSNFEAFLIPAGTFITIRQGVWHGCQLPVEKETVRSLILLPEMTYANDTYCYFFEKDQRICIE